MNGLAVFMDSWICWYSELRAESCVVDAACDASDSMDGSAPFAQPARRPTSWPGMKFR